MHVDAVTCGTSRSAHEQVIVMYVASVRTHDHNVTSLGVHDHVVTGMDVISLGTHDHVTNMYGPSLGAHDHVTVMYVASLGAHDNAPTVMECRCTFILSVPHSLQVLQN